MAEIQQTGDDFIIATGHYSYADVEMGWMPIKKGRTIENGGLSIPKAVVMTHQYKPGEHVDDPGTTTFNFVVATNVVEQAIEDGKVVGSYKDPLHNSMKQLHQQLLNEATMAFAEWLGSVDDPNRRKQMPAISPASPEGFAYA